jgi:hypothetical protein
MRYGKPDENINCFVESNLVIDTESLERTVPFNTYKRILKVISNKNKNFCKKLIENI